MADTHNSIRVPLGAPLAVEWGSDRHREPIRIGIPVPAGAVFSPDEIELDTQALLASPLQVRTLDAWPDGSIRWALVDAFVDAFGPSVGQPASSRDQQAVASPLALQVFARDKTITVDTGVATFGFEVGGSFPFSSVTIGTKSPVDADASGLRIETDRASCDFRIAGLRAHATGPLRAELELSAEATAAPVDVAARVELFAGTATARIAVTIRNCRRAQHPGGHWMLGDGGSVYLRSAVLRLNLGGRIVRAQCAPERGQPLVDVEVPFELLQESSGGDRWDGPIHRNREGRVPLRFRGYRLQSGAVERAGHRATPIVVVHTDRGEIAVTLPRFWENFPRAIGLADGTIEVGLFPRQSADAHELQGGEQKTHEIVVAFDGDTVSDPPLAWCHDPLFVCVPPEWCSATGAVPYLIPAAADPNRRYVDLAGVALDPVRGFAIKNERADEYGWRNHGDLHADHESAFQPPDRPFVSHYNNQYDAIAAFALHYLRTADRRWWQLMTNLARHVRDIDIYWTRDDKAAYNGGLFWHTSHYVDAGLSTHRTYAVGAPGGGPSSEHNYNAGLMLHYFMTGETASRDAAIGLGRWVLDMDDGRQTVFRWLAGGATGLASASGSADYHGPGRGSANSILACLVAHRLTNAPEYAVKADELIRRCIHPRDDLHARNLLDVERRWFYTVFLQSLGWYLHCKAERQQIDGMFEYARASLLHYARWVAANERPYLERPDVLEFPTETWIAQDLRKADVLLWAAQHTTAAERARFLERSRFFFDYAVNALSASATYHFTRPLVLLLANGVRDGWFRTHGLPPPGPMEPVQHGAPPRPFVPQKTRAMRRAAGLTIAAVMAGVAALAWWIL